MVNPTMPGADVDDIEETLFNLSIDDGIPPYVVGRTESPTPSRGDHTPSLGDYNASPEAHLSAFSSTESSSPASPPSLPPPEPAVTPQPTSLPSRSSPVGSVSESGFASATMNDSGRFTHGHQDIVQAISYNFHGNRIVTASSDHHLKVWDKQANGQWRLVDTWRGHDAEIMEVGRIQAQ